MKLKIEDLTPMLLGPRPLWERGRVRGIMDSYIVYRHAGYKPGDEVGIVDTLKEIFGD